MGRRVRQIPILLDAGLLRIQSPTLKCSRPFASSRSFYDQCRKNLPLHLSRQGRPSETSRYARLHLWHLPYHSRMPPLCRPLSERRAHQPSPAEHHGLHHQRHENQILTEAFPLNLSCQLYSSENQVSPPYQTTR